MRMQRCMTMKPDEFIMQYLKDMDFTSPTEIGDAYGEYKHGRGHFKTGYHSAWASPRCLKLVDSGVLERNDKGHYRISNS